MYHGLWGGLLSQAAAPAPPAASTSVSGALHGALSELQSRLLARLAGSADASDAASTDGSSVASSVLSKLDGYLAERLNATLALLGRSADRSAGGGGGGSTHVALPPPGGANWSAAEALELAVQAWALGALAGGSGAAAGGLVLHALGSGGGSGGASSGLGLEGPALVASPSWEAFRPLLCLRLQNLGNADGWSSVLLGPAPCSKGSAAVTSDAFRWRTSAAFLLDCSRRGGGVSSSDTGSGGVALSSLAGSGGSACGAAAASVAGALAEAGMAAAERVAASLAAAVSSRRTCRLALGSTSGGAGAAEPTTGSAAQLEYSFEQPLSAAPKMDALRLRVCNM